MSQVKKVGAGNFVHVLYLYIHDNKMNNPIALKGKDLSIEDNGGSFTMRTLYIHMCAAQPAISAIQCDGQKLTRSRGRTLATF